VDTEKIEVTMILTTLTYTYTAQLIRDVKNALFSNPNVRDVSIHLTFGPPWSLEIMSSKSKQKLLWITQASESGQVKE
jgi:metal-sulfur cluster biosynthetic enzyme